MNNFRLRTRLLPFSTLCLTGALALGMTACKSNTADGPDPAAANLAQVGPVAGQQTANGQPARVLGQSSAYTPQQQGENYPPDSNYYPNGYDPNDQNGQPYYEATQAPPPLPVNQQPRAPGEGYIWTPGYWAHGASGYYWVQGAWKQPPYRGALYTPGYWHNSGRTYVFKPGYWGPHVGYYGGIDYGAGYVGTGYQGGYWNGSRFLLNVMVNNVAPGFSAVYRRPVMYENRTYGPEIVRTTSYNGLGGVVYEPRPYEVVAMRERHVPYEYAPREVYARGPEHVIVNNGHPEGFIPGSPRYGDQRVVVVEGKHWEKDQRHEEKQFEKHGEGHDEDGGEGHGHGEGHGKH